jgi:hypothetical protein
VNNTAKLELSVLAAALTLGVLGDGLLRCFPWGVNFALWAGALAVAMFFLGRARREVFAQGGGWLLVPLALSPLAFLWQESPQLKALNLLALLTALAMAILRARGRQLQASTLAQYVLGGLLSGFNAAFGIFPLLFGNAEWRQSLRGGSRSGALVLRGAAFSVVPMLVFGSLLMAADAVFQNLIHRIFRFDFTHLVVIGFVFWWVGGYLRGLLLGKELRLGTEKVALPFSLGATEIGVMLGLLDLLFAAFVAVQVRYFFGGSALVHATTGLTYAEYARRGFFQLLTVAALLLPFLLMVHWLMRQDDPRGQRLFIGLAGVQIALLFVIMASAFQRMWLYQAEYGLSESRLYPTAFMCWLAVVFVWFCLTVLRGHRERFAFGAMIAGFLLVGALHLLNPDALIARTNLKRACAGHIFDAGYLASLSADAVPELTAGLSGLNPRDRCTVTNDLLQRWSPAEKSDWRSWNLSSAQARQAVSRNESTLRAACLTTKR